MADIWGLPYVPWSCVPVITCANQINETQLNSGVHGVVTVFLHNTLNFNLCCIQWYVSQVHRLSGSGDMAPHPNQIHETCWIHARVHSSKSDGVVTVFPYNTLNFNLCCIQWCTSHVHRLSGLGYGTTNQPTRTKSMKHGWIDEFIAPNLMGLS